MQKIKILMLAEWMDNDGRTATRYKAGINYVVEPDVARRAIEAGRASAVNVRQDAPPLRCVWRKPPAGEPVEAGFRAPLAFDEDELAKSGPETP